MAILIVLPNDALGGAEQYLKMLASYHIDNEVTIYFLKKNNTKQWESIEGITHQHFMSSTHELIGLIRFVFIMLFKNTKCDYTFSSHTKINALLDILRSLQIIKTKYLVVRESTSIFLRYKGLKLKYYKLLYAIGYNKTDLIICQTDVMKKQFLDFNPKISKRTVVAVIPNPIDLSNANKNASEVIKTDTNYVVSAGRFIPLKGFDLLIKAFSEIKKTQPQLKLILLGEGPEKQSLELLSKELQLENDVVFAGHVANVYTYFKHARLCVVSSKIEGFPNVLLQMMSQNTKVVSTLCAGGIADIPGIFTCETNSDVALEKTMIKCLSENTEQNTLLFNNFLKSRTMEAFMNTVNKKLETL